MARIDSSGTSEMIQMLSGLGRETSGICKYGLYAGAGVMADALAAAVEDLPTEPFHPLPGASNGGDPLNVLTEDDKEDLRAGLAIAKFEDTGDGVNTAVSFNGYSRHASKQFPDGIPLPVIARSIESGSSTRKKRPFVRHTATAQESTVQQATEEHVFEAIDSYVNTGALPPFAGGPSKGNGKGIHKKTNK